ncbi:Uncharacterised protein [Mycobacteroides abscessus subsp. abscessus]|nr:Uncharacterised protein [Mycobacteroides abscessus subsp. abscessus]
MEAAVKIMPPPTTIRVIPVQPWVLTSGATHLLVSFAGAGSASACFQIRVSPTPAKANGQNMLNGTPMPND